MDSVTMKLSGTLGDRHRCFNALVHEAYQQNTSLPVPHPEEATLDRLFKIDLASKQRNEDFIITTLKDDDLLYVNRALKNQWLLEPQYSNIINPIFLETELFPEMTLPAVNKMRHWIQMHLRDPQRCKEFHQFYKQLDADIAVKFLWHCSNEYVLDEISDVLEKITPKLLKRLSEKVPRITKIYYDSLRNNQTLLKYYMTNDSKFFANIKYLLKTDASIFFYVLENFFVPRKFGTFNAAVTRSIMQDHKSRFLYKPELYTVCFLDMITLARQLSSEEIKELVLKLARAEYLKSWFSYQSVEPLLERLSEEERLLFTNLVFVNKAFGPTVREWPYSVPVPPVLLVPQKHFYDDIQQHARRYLDRSDISEFEHNISRFVLKKPRHARKINLTQTLLDELFEKYRFCTYGQTFVEFQTQLRAESTAQNRMFMLLVLVSKTGGRIEYVVSLLDLLWQHKNEPVHIRAAIVRSLVKRACVWRLPTKHWTRLLKWGHDLGLDGSTSEANCLEGFHAVVIRDLLADGTSKPSEAVWEKFLTDYFNTLKEYLFTADERRCVQARLPALLLNTLLSKPDDSKLILLNRLLDTLEAYHVRFDDFPGDGIVDAVTAAVKYNWDTAREDAKRLLKRLYDAGVKRKYLIREYFEIRQTDASYVNALRHDISILDNTEKFEKLIEVYVEHDKFFRKLALYFMEKKGLGEKYRAVLEQSAASGVILARCRSRRSRYMGLANGRQILALPLALLCGSHFPALLKTLDAAPRKTPQRQLAAALRSNAHVVRPAFDLESFGWRQAGAKAVANRVATCRERDVKRYLQECLTWRRTLRLALVPAKRVNKERDAFQVLASQRPGAALRAAFGYFCRERGNSDPCIWEMVKSYISKLGIRQLRLYIEFIEFVPAVIKAEYCYLVYKATKQDTLHFQCKVLSEIPALLVDINEQYIYDAIDGFMCEYFKDCVTVKEKVIVEQDDSDFGYCDVSDSNKKYIYLYIEIIAKFLVLSTSAEMLEERYRKVALPFLDRLELFWEQISHKDVPIEKFLGRFLFYLRYNKVYFDFKYVSCLPVFEKITEWMHGFMPIEKWFDKYVTVHLTMIYYKTVRHCIEQNADLLSESNALEGSYMLGTIFGNCLSNEIEELTQKYFLTITEVYGCELVDYIYEYITHVNNECFMKFMTAVLKALVVNKAVSSCILAKYLFTESRDYRICSSWFNSEYIKDIFEQFNKSGIKDIQKEFRLIL